MPCCVSRTAVSLYAKTFWQDRFVVLPADCGASSLPYRLTSPQVSFMPHVHYTRPASPLTNRVSTVGSLKVTSKSTAGSRFTSGHVSLRESRTSVNIFYHLGKSSSRVNGTELGRTEDRDSYPRRSSLRAPYHPIPADSTTL